MVRIDILGDRTCMALCWVGILYILYSHMLA